jgi:hypothetical protein
MTTTGLTLAAGGLRRPWLPLPFATKKSEVLA